LGSRVSARWSTTRRGAHIVVWDLKGLAKRTYQITTAVELQALIEEEVGVILTVQTVRALMRRAPPAPRTEMIQLLCDVFDCRSDAFYVCDPNPARRRQWANAKLVGKKPSPLYGSKSAEHKDEFVTARHETVDIEAAGKPSRLLKK